MPQRWLGKFETGAAGAIGMTGFGVAVLIRWSHGCCGQLIEIYLERWHNPRMNPYDAPATPPEPRKPGRSITLAMWAVIILAAMLLVELAVVKMHRPQVRTWPSDDAAVPPVAD